MTPAANSFTAGSFVLAQNLFELWLLPMRMTQHFFAASADMARATTVNVMAAASDMESRTTDAIEDAEEKIAKIDEGSSPAIVHPGALVG